MPQIYNSKSGSVGYPDIGAIPHKDMGFGTICSEDNILPYGYVNHTYEIIDTFTDLTAVLTINSGALPTGLALSNYSPGVWKITGTPSVAGDYTFTLRITIGTETTDITKHITISEDPDTGSSFVGGGF